VKPRNTMENFAQVTLKHTLSDKFDGKCYKFSIPVKTRLFFNTSRESWYAICNYLQLPQIKRSYQFQTERKKYVNCFKFERLLTANEVAYYKYHLCRNNYEDGLEPPPLESLTDGQEGFPHPEEPPSEVKVEAASYRTGSVSERFQGWLGGIFDSGEEVWKKK